MFLDGPRQYSLRLGGPDPIICRAYWTAPEVGGSSQLQSSLSDVPRARRTIGANGLGGTSDKRAMNETHDTLWELYGSASEMGTYEELRERPAVWRWKIHGSCGSRIGTMGFVALRKYGSQFQAMEPERSDFGRRRCVSQRNHGRAHVRPTHAKRLVQWVLFRPVSQYVRVDVTAAWMGRPSAEARLPGRLDRR